MGEFARVRLALLFVAAWTGATAGARRGRARAAVVSYSVPRFETTTEGTSVGVDVVGVFATTGAFFLLPLGGMLTACVLRVSSLCCGVATGNALSFEAQGKRDGARLLSAIDFHEEGSSCRVIARD